MKYVILDDDKKVIDILIDNAIKLYPDKQFLEVADETAVAVGMVYDEIAGTFAEYIEPAPEPEPSQLDRIEANTQSLMSSNSALDVLLGVSE